MNIHANFYTDLAVVGIAITAGISRWKRLNIVSKIFFFTMVWYFFAQVVTEGGLLYGNFRERFPGFYYMVRSLQTIVEFTLCTLFYNFSIDQFRRKRIAGYIIPAAIIAWAGSAIAFRHTENFNVYFAPMACFASIILSIIAIYHLQNENSMQQLWRMPTFGFAVLQLFFYGGFFFFLLSYPLILKNRQAELFAIYIVFRLTNIYYAGAALIYFFYPRKSATG